MGKSDWGPWVPVPPPDRFKHDVAGPVGPGVYQLRNRETKELILFGISGNLSDRLRSLMPKPHGTGTRNNAEKRAFVLAHHAVIDYRLRLTETREQAKAIEDLLKADGFHRFNT